MDVERPLDALNASRNKRVLVELQNKRQLVGTLKAFDIHINLVLDDVEERENGEMVRKLGTVFVRGGIVVLVSPAQEFYMTKGTPSKGKGSGKRTHIHCRRCGKISYHMRKKVCSSCGFGKSAKVRTYVWRTKKKGKRVK